MHTPTIKPFDTETVLAQIDSDRLVVTLENHTVVGGLFETVAGGRRAARARQADHPDRPARRVPGRGRAADPARPLRPVDAPIVADVLDAAVTATINCRQLTIAVDRMSTEGGSCRSNRASLLRLEKTSLREQALTALRRAITTGQLAPGTHLVETELSDALQISRGTLREAMRQLQQEGLISAGRARPAVGAPPRRQGDQATSSTSARRWSRWRHANWPTLPDRSAAAAALRNAVDDMERWAASNLEDRIEADLRFHRTMCQLTGNETLLHSWIVAGGQHPDVDHVRRRRPGDQEHGRRAAPRIVDAIESGDADKAAAKVRDHMAGAAKTLVSGAA